MEGESSLKLTLFFLLIATLCSEAQLQFKYYSDPQQRWKWSAARSYCQRTHTDMLGWSTIPVLASHWRTAQHVNVWIGVRRDPEQPSVWWAINLKTGEGLSGDDLSQNTHWGNREQTIHLCAHVETNLKLYSAKCNFKRTFYCTNEDGIYFHNKSVQWQTAFNHCRNNRSVLATITESNKGNFGLKAWIGLFRENGKNWTWIGNSTSDYTKWASWQNEHEPLDCAVLRPDRKRWYSTWCHHHNRFVCYEDNLVMVNEKKTWEEALRHCREMDTSCVDDDGHPKHCYDLLSLTNSSHYGYVRDKIYNATTDEVWIGLRFLAGEWWWLNGEKPQDQEMLPSCPSQWNYCGSFSKYNTSSVKDQQSLIIKDCSERRNFICQQSGNKWQNKDEFEGMK